MEYLTAIKNEIPDWAKDIRLNLDSLLARPGKLSREDALATALASAFAAKSPFLIEQFKSGLSETDATAALTAAALMGMNNVWYPYGEMTGDEQLKKIPPWSAHERLWHARRCREETLRTVRAGGFDYR